MTVLITLVVLVLIAVLCYWLISSAPIPGPMAPTIKWALYAILAIVIIFYIIEKIIPALRL